MTSAQDEVGLPDQCGLACVFVLPPMTCGDVTAPRRTWHHRKWERGLFWVRLVRSHVKTMDNDMDYLHYHVIFSPHLWCSHSLCFRCEITVTSQCNENKYSTTTRAEQSWDCLDETPCCLSCVLPVQTLMPTEEILLWVFVNSLTSLKPDIWTGFSSTSRLQDFTTISLVIGTLYISGGWRSLSRTLCW